MKLFRFAGLAVLAMAGLGMASLAMMAAWTEREIDALRDAAGAQASSHPPAPPDAASLAGLPAPVQHWVQATFPSGWVGCTQVEVSMSGRFRRPRTQGFAPTTANQLLAAGTPALVFDATTTALPGIWARAFDGYVGGRMTMKARLLSALTVVDEASTPALDRTSLRRWLLESAFCPTALLPGGPVSWQAIDASHARAVARWGGIEATLVASFDSAGRLVQFDAEDEGDLSLPYHGSGERVVRSDFRLVRGMWIPHRFVISRVARGQAEPFWDGEVTSVQHRIAAAGGAQ